MILLIHHLAVLLKCLVEVAEASGADDPDLDGVKGEHDVVLSHQHPVIYLLGQGVEAAPPILWSEIHEHGHVPQDDHIIVSLFQALLKYRCKMAGEKVTQDGVEQACSKCTGIIVVEEGAVGQKHYLKIKGMLSPPRNPDIICPATLKDPGTSDLVEEAE